MLKWIIKESFWEIVFIFGTIFILVLSCIILTPLQVDAAREQTVLEETPHPFPTPKCNVTIKRYCVYLPVVCNEKDSDDCSWCPALCDPIHLTQTPIWPVSCPPGGGLDK